MDREAVHRALDFSSVIATIKYQIGFDLDEEHGNFSLQDDTDDREVHGLEVFKTFDLRGDLEGFGRMCVQEGVEGAVILAFIGSEVANDIKPYEYCNEL